MHPHTVCVYNTRITCTECKDAASCCRCSVVYRLLSVSVCWSQMQAQQMAKANDVWVVESGGPKEPYFGAQMPSGEGTILGIGPYRKCIVTVRAPKTAI